MFEKFNELKLFLINTNKEHKNAESLFTIMLSLIFMAPTILAIMSHTYFLLFAAMPILSFLLYEFSVIENKKDNYLKDRNEEKLTQDFLLKNKQTLNSYYELIQELKLAIFILQIKNEETKDGLNLIKEHHSIMRMLTEEIFYNQEVLRKSELEPMPSKVEEKFSQNNKMIFNTFKELIKTLISKNYYLNRTSKEDIPLTHRDLINEEALLYCSIVEKILLQKYEQVINQFNLSEEDKSLLLSIV